MTKYQQAADVIKRYALENGFGFPSLIVIKDQYWSERDKRMCDCFELAITQKNQPYGPVVFHMGSPQRPHRFKTVEKACLVADKISRIIDPVKYQGIPKFTMPFSNQKAPCQ